ncbi:MAG: HAD-IA family hydrolase [Chitinivibrionales bacterium]|nr:HAD-IA family hydrolase [Chitinivibrionales bacterium]
MTSITHHSAGRESARESIKGTSEIIFYRFIRIRTAEMKPYTCYLFDADGTLIDTAELIFQSFRYSCKKFGPIDIPRSRVIEHIGLPLRTQAELYLGPMNDNEYAAFSSEHMCHQLQISPEYLRVFDGVTDVLSALKSCGAQLAVVTSRRRDSLNKYLHTCGLQEYFDICITPEDTVRHKPDPDPALLAMQRLSATARETIFIGDAEFDILCGKQAGIDTAYIIQQHNSPQRLKTQPTYLLHSLHELLTNN